MADWLFPAYRCPFDKNGSNPDLAIATTIISGYISGIYEGARAVSPSQSRALANYRTKLKGKGVVRLEVNVQEKDAGLVRGVVKALADPMRCDEARALLRERFGGDNTGGLKALLAAAPFEGIDLDRERDFGRDVAL